MPHKGGGFITISWISVDPLPRYLTAINGDSIEILTARLPAPIAASCHRVRHMAHEPGRTDRTISGPR